jgi:hypothetical protein
MKVTEDTVGAFVDVLRHDGFAFVPGDAMRDAFAQAGSLADWDAFAASWNDLALDTHMADHGRYRRRRHAVYRAGADGAIERQTHQPHYQSLDYNRLNGGVARWFEPIVADGASLATILAYCRGLFGALAPDVARWHVEAHQFRIEARQGEAGLPTPEGVHRDGVDYVLVLLVARRNIASGTTTIHRQVHADARVRRRARRRRARASRRHAGRTRRRIAAGIPRRARRDVQGDGRGARVSRASASRP